jgi:hypothetical protein
VARYSDSDDFLLLMSRVRVVLGNWEGREGNVMERTQGLLRSHERVALLPLADEDKPTRVRIPRSYLEKA